MKLLSDSHLFQYTVITKASPEGRLEHFLRLDPLALLCQRLRQPSLARRQALASRQPPVHRAPAPGRDRDRARHHHLHADEADWMDR